MQKSAETSTPQKPLLQFWVVQILLWFFLASICSFAYVQLFLFYFIILGVKRWFKVKNTIKNMLYETIVLSVIAIFLWYCVV